MELYLLIFLNCIFLGTLYALTSAGLSLIYGVMKIINVAHAGLMMFGAYFAFTLLSYLNIDPLISSIVSIPLAIILGVLIYRVFLTRIIYAPPQVSLLLLFAFWLILQDLAYVLFTGDTRSIMMRVPYAFSIYIGAPVGVQRLVVLVVSILVMLGTHFFLTKTMLGKAVRSVAQDREAASWVGINNDYVFGIAFGIGVALAFVSGCLASLLYPFDPTFGGPFLMKAFVVTVLGGLESMLGIFLAALVVGAVESIGGFYLRFGLVDTFTYALFLIVLVLRPQGLFGRT